MGGVLGREQRGCQQVVMGRWVGVLGREQRGCQKSMMGRWVGGFLGRGRGVVV